VPAPVARSSLRGLFEIAAGLASVAGVPIGILATALDTEGKVLTILAWELFTYAVAVTYILVVRSREGRSAQRPPVRIVREIEGEGSLQGATVYALSYRPDLAVGTILTVCSEAQGPLQPLGLIEVTRVNEPDDVLALPFPNGGVPTFEIDKYLDRGTGQYKLSVIPAVHTRDLRNIIENLIGKATQ
jgi:hypothetical protein